MQCIHIDISLCLVFLCDILQQQNKASKLFTAGIKRSVFTLTSDSFSSFFLFLKIVCSLSLVKRPKRGDILQQQNKAGRQQASNAAYSC